MSGACGVLASSISSVLAQDTSEVAEVVVVTGSYIRGSAEDAALPIDVISAEELEKSGSPSTVDILKNLSVSTGALGDTNQFAAGAQGTEGTGSVNLRNLGRQRTLVLLNGRRLVNAPQSGSPDTNLIPQAAIGRIEVLKDGAAATYGSDAIAGVVNFITNDRLDGFEVGGSYKQIDSTDGDYDSKIAYGWQGDRSSLIVTAGYQHRSELRVRDRSFAQSSFLENPQSYSSGGNPGTFLILPGANAGMTGAAAATLADPNCATVGGTPGVTDGNAPVCYFNFAPFDNLVEKQDQYQGYTEYNLELGASTKLHVEGFYSQTDVPEYRTSPSFLANQVPTFGPGLGQTNFPVLAGNNRAVVPNINPGIQDLQATLAAIPVGQRTPAQISALNNLMGGGAVAILNPLERAFGVGGRPGTGTNISDRSTNGFRLSAGLNGEVSPAFKWDFGVTYSQDNYRSTNNDIIVNRFQQALKGFGGFNCTGNMPGQNGCLFYNPFSNAFATNAITGQANPVFSNQPGRENTAEVANYLFGDDDLDQKSDQIVVDAVLSGETGISLPGGKIGWAGGAQFREETFQTRYNALSNYAINPCVDIGSRACLIDQATGLENPARATGVFTFLGGGNNQDLLQNVYAVFGEVSLPVLDSVQVQIAARYEDYGGSIGDTFNPKLSVRWQIADWVAVRGSAGSSFRGPPVNALTNNSATALQFLQAAGGFRAVRVFGNPDLKPEKADSFNVGLLFNVSGFRASLDYFNYDFEDNFVNEDFTAIVTEVFRSGAVNCASPVASRLNFNSGMCVQTGPSASRPGDVNSVTTKVINGAGLKEDGLDLNAEYSFNNVFGGQVNLGLNASYILNFDVNAQPIEGLVLTPKFDGAGFSNVNRGFTPLPELKGSAFVEWNRGGSNLRLTTRYTDGYIDSRSTFNDARNIFTARPSTNNVAVTRGRRIDNFLTADLSYVLQLPAETTFSASVSNLTDKNPPFARLELGYDPGAVSPIGRAIEVGFRKKF